MIVDGRVLVCNPPHHFAHTHRFTQHDDPVCEVHYELKDLGDGAVEVTLRVVGIPEGTATGKAMASGGDFILKHLKLLAEGQGLPLSTKLMYFMDEPHGVSPAQALPQRQLAHEGERRLR